MYIHVFLTFIVNSWLICWILCCVFGGRCESTTSVCLRIIFYVWEWIQYLWWWRWWYDGMMDESWCCVVNTLFVWIDCCMQDHVSVCVGATWSNVGFWDKSAALSLNQSRWIVSISFSEYGEMHVEKWGRGSCMRKKSAPTIEREVNMKLYALNSQNKTLIVFFTTQWNQDLCPHWCVFGHAQDFAALHYTHTRTHSHTLHIHLNPCPEQGVFACVCVRDAIDTYLSRYT